MGSLALKRAIVTGPTGAVGTALIEELAAHGVEMVAVCRPSSARRSAIPDVSGLTVVECDAADYRLLPELLKGVSADAFYHFAWAGTFGAARQDWDMQCSNIQSAVDAVHAAHALGCKVFVGAGSQSEFGHVDGVLHPDMPCNPDNGYGAAKLAACVMSRALCGHLGMRHEWCRIVSLYGPRDAEYTLISTCIRTLLKGEHLSCTPCDQIWDYIYSKDAARAFRLVAERGRHGEVYCLGSGASAPLREYVELIRDVVSPDAQVGFGELDYYPNQVMRLEPDISNLVRDTGFTPSWSFEQGIRETVDWYRANRLDS